MEFEACIDCGLEKSTRRQRARPRCRSCSIREVHRLKGHIANSHEPGVCVDCGAVIYSQKAQRCKSCARRWDWAIGTRKPRHGHTCRTQSNKSSRTYESWCHMKDRCGNPRNHAYAYYGGRGISVCDRWQTSFEAFVADLGERPLGLSLDRIDNDGNYEPGNCRWATPSEQNNNRRTPEVAA